MVMILIGFASAFSYRMAIMQLPANLSSLFVTVSDNKYVILLRGGQGHHRAGHEGDLAVLRRDAGNLGACDLRAGDLHLAA